MSRKAIVQLASRALGLNLLVISLGWLVSVPRELFSLVQYRNIGFRTPSQQYLYTSDFITLLSHLLFALALMVAAASLYQNSPFFERFLTPSDE